MTILTKLGEGCDLEPADSAQVKLGPTRLFGPTILDNPIQLYN
jgi:hypothetical protein